MQKARVDIAVMGAGLAGLTAACRAQELGASVLVLEAGEGERYPANSRYTGGVFHVAFEDVTAGPEALSAAITAAGGDFPIPTSRAPMQAMPGGRWTGLPVAVPISVRVATSPG